MKRLVVCCDGTWKAESSSTVSNIIKIAQTIRYEASKPSGEPIQQWVSYVSGPGARGFLADRLMGGAFGLGLEANLSSAYWHLALNWQPGDEIYIFGFSRGAFTARSLAGLIGRIGIMTPDAMIEGKYPDALRIHHQPAPPRTPENPDPKEPQEWIDFRKRNCWDAPAKIDFIGVFDTVGALGVPGLTSLRHRFHDVKLGRNVYCARQALALDERRRNFEPCLWEVPIEPDVKYSRVYDRVKQVWFEGVHSDIGGGYQECGLSDITLRWMVEQAEAVGLVFDRDRLEGLSQRCAASGAKHMELHRSLGLGYRILNVLRTIRQPRNPRFYWDSWRRLYTDGDRGVRLASTVHDATDYRPANLVRWLKDNDGIVPETLIEKTGTVTVLTSEEPSAHQ
ncbi:DUF2235 domain-containing protein [Nocardia sp. NPDC050630]|uniref:DUF2235 domain-containing protein n=1 Tax=Nocardia sp. NPDC050630 TaxID=3364321 RepID=UPI0037B07C2A